MNIVRVSLAMTVLVDGSIRECRDGGVVIFDDPRLQLSAQQLEVLRTIQATRLDEVLGTGPPISLASVAAIRDLSRRPASRRFRDVGHVRR